MALEQQVFELARWLLTAVTLWWVLGAALWLGALGSDHVWLGRIASTVSLPGTRRIARAILTLSLTALPACSPDQATPSLVYLGDAPATTTTAALATTAPSVTTPSTTRPPASPPPTTPSSTTPSSTTPSSTTGPSTTGPSTTEPSNPPPSGADPSVDQDADTELPAATEGYEVVAGDHLWSIAAQHLSSNGEAPTNAAIAQHWRRVITANAATIRSGDPNLIFPGEVLTLPPPP